MGFPFVRLHVFPKHVDVHPESVPYMTAELDYVFDFPDSLDLLIGESIVGTLDFLDLRFRSQLAIGLNHALLGSQPNNFGWIAMKKQSYRDAMSKIGY